MARPRAVQTERTHAARDAARAARRKARPAAENPLRGLSESQRIDADNVKLLAAKFCLLHFPTLYTAGTPRPSPGSNAGLWIVPIVIAHPDRDALGEVGELVIDPRTQQVVGGTPRSEVLAAGRELYKVARAAP